MTFEAEVDDNRQTEEWVTEAGGQRPLETGRICDFPQVVGVGVRSECQVSSVDQLE